ncbi:galectin-1-like [Sminthopsis crassicaudata]|uniref:galectin-1-like n=1 Tax=Sminthopsis crassicaudata TaxID=9301 RepID=UPI003D68D1FA
MVKDMVAFNFRLLPGGTIKIEGEIPPDAKQFKLKLGKDRFNIGILLNPIFNHGGKKNVIHYNYMTQGVWRDDKKMEEFPFMPGSKVEVCINFVGHFFLLFLPGNVKLNFFNHLCLLEINYFQVSGDFKVQKVTFE